MGTNARRRKGRARARRQQGRERRPRGPDFLAGLIADVQTRTGTVQDPATPPEEAARAFLGFFEGGIPLPGMSRVVEAGVPGRAAAVAEAVMALEGPDGVVGLVLAADLAEREERRDGAEDLYREALERARRAVTGREPFSLESGSSVPSELGVRLAGCLLERERLADALDELSEACREDPGHEAAQQVRAEALLRALERRGKLDEAESCPCGSGRPHGECCRPREAAALERFADRSPMYELRDALRPFLERPEIDPYVMEAVRDWYLGQTPEEMGDPDEHEVRMAIERALITKGPRPDDDDHVLLDAFAEDAGTPAHLARGAREWRAFARFGLWEVADTTPDPGLLLQDVVSGEFVYAAVAPEQLAGVPRWSVLMGAVIPVEGVWRSGASFLSMTPDEGRAVAEEALAVARKLLPHMLPRGVAVPMQREIDGRRRELRARTPSEGRTPASAALADFLGTVVGGALPELRQVLRELRARPVDLRNSDGERLELITARVRLEDRLKAEDAMEARPDFESDETGWIWFGKPAKAGSRPAPGVIGMGQGQSVRAAIEVAGLDEFRVEVNSRGRLDRLLEILRRAGAGPTVVSETKVDPALDLPTPGEAVGVVPRRTREHEAQLAKLEAEAMAEWRRTWVDEPVPALGGRTPREAATDPEARLLLESLLRDLEFRDDVIRARGGSDHGVADLRRVLGLATGSDAES